MSGWVPRRDPGTAPRSARAGLLSLLLIVAACESQPTTAIASFCKWEKGECEAVQGLCEVAVDCEGMQLLVAEEECSKQLAEALFPTSMAEHARLCRANRNKEHKCAQKSVRTPTRIEKDIPAACHVCVTSLSCDGLIQLASGEAKLAELCAACTGSSLSAVHKDVPYAVLPIIAAAPASATASAEASSAPAPPVPAPTPSAVAPAGSAPAPSAP